MSESFFATNLLQEIGPFFRLLHDTKRSQTGFMTVPPGQEAGAPETHPGADQVFYVVQGEAEFRVWENGEDHAPATHKGGPGTLVVVPAGIQHWVASVGKQSLFFLTVYAPPEY